jgi:YARHG domain
LAKANKEVESRIDKKKIEKRFYIDGKTKQILSFILPIVGAIILGATAIFYVYPKITNGVNKPSKTASTEVVKEEKNDKKEVKATEKTNKKAKEKTSKDTATTKKSDKVTNPEEYIFPTSDTERLTDEMIASISIIELRLARNEIYARHGLIFKSRDLNDYFSTKSWYSPDSSYDGNTLNEVEKYNLNLIKAREDAIK